MFTQTLKNRVLFERTLTPILSVVFAIAAITYGGFLFSPDKAYAATNNTLNFQARLEGSGGAIAPDGYYNVEFKLYSVSTGGSALWTETYYDSNGGTAGNDNRIRVQNGYLTANLGIITAFPGTINWDQDLYITLNVGGTTQTATPTWDGEMSPRLKLTGVPYAFRAGQLAQFNVTSGFTSTLSLLQPTVGNQTFQIQDQGAAGTYNICIQSSSACGFVAGTASNFIQNGTSQQAGSNFNISGTGVASTLQATAFDTAAAGTLSIGTTNATTVNIATNAAAHTIAIGTSAAAAQTITIGSSNASSTTSITGGASSLSVANGGLTIAGNTTTSGTISTTAGGAAGVGTQALASSLYIQSRGTNLVTNGTGLLGNNYNFSGFVFDPQNVSAGGGSFKNSTASANVTNDELLPVDPNSTYQLNLAAMSSVYVAGNRAYFGVAPYDIDGNQIYPYQYSKYSGSTDTTLAAPLNPGDTTVTLTNASGWYNSTGSYQSNFAWYGYTNAKGYTYPNYTYSRNNSSNYSSNDTLGAWASAGISGNVITLRVPWAGPAIASGVAVRNSTSGGTYKYVAASNVEVPSTWTTYSGRIGGIDVSGTMGTNLFPYGTAYVKLLFLMNRDVTGNTTNLSNISFTDNSGVFQAKTAPSVPVIVQGAASQTGNLFQAQNSSGSVLMGVTSTGLINTTAGFSYNGTAGATTTCGAGTYLNSQVIQGGITTGGTCTTVPTGVGSFVSLQGSTPGTPDTGNLNITGTGIFGTAVQAPLYDTASAVALNIGTTNATVINLNKDVTVAAGKYISLVGGITSTRPASPTEGMLYFDTTTKQLLVYANGKWQADRSSNTKLVAANNSQGKDAADFVVSATDETNGNADAAINAAIAALPSTGGSVYLMEGTYTIDTTIALTTNVSLIGSGTSTIIKLKNSINASINAISATGSAPNQYRVAVKDMIIDGNKANNTAGTQYGIYTIYVANSQADGITVEGVTVQNFRSAGIYFAPFTNNSRIIGSTITGNTSNGVYIDGNSTNNRVINNSITSNGQGFYTGGNYTIVEGNNISSNTGVGAEFYLGSDGVLSNNSIRSNGSTGVIANGKNTNVTGNSVISNTGYGMVVSAQDEVIINNNEISSNTSAGIYLYISDRHVVTGNTIRSNAASAIRIYMSNNSIISDNYLYQNGGSGSNAAIDLDNVLGSDNVKITNNTLEDSTGTGNAITIGNKSDNTYLSNNTFVGVGVAGIADTGVGTVYVNQLDSSGNLINKNAGGGLAVGKTSATTTLDVQGGLKVGQLPTPGAPTLANAGTAGTTSRTYAVSALDGNGETLASTGTAITTSNATLDATNYVIVTFTAVPGAVSYKIYRTVSAGTPSTTGLIGTVAGNVRTFNDTGLAGAGSTPAANTTGTSSIAGTLTLGLASSVNASLVLNNSTNANTVTINSGVTSASYAMTLPTAIAATGDCLKAGTVAGGNVPLTFGTCATSNPTMQNVYDNSGTANPQILLNATNGGIKIADAATPISGNLLSIQNNAATATFLGLTSSALTLQDSSGNSAFVFDMSNSRLRVYENVASPTRYADIYYDTANNEAVYAASSGNTRVGNGSGNVTGSLTGQNDIFSFSKTYTPAGAYSLNDFTIQRALTASALATSGSVLRVEDASTGSAVAPNVLLINQNNTSATGNLILAQTGGSTTRMALSTGGNLTVSGNYISGASTGVARTCTTGQVLAAETTVGGIVTGGTCTAVDSFTTLQEAYDNSGSPASILLGDAKNFLITAADTTTDPNVLINLQCVTGCSTNGRFAIQDAGTDVFTVNPDGSIVVGSATNGMTFNATTKEPTLTGTARHTRRITLVPEFMGAVMTPDGTSNTGTMTSDFCSGTSRLSINTGVCAATAEHNYYSWTTASGTDQDYDIYVKYQMPSDFDGFTSSTSINMFGWRTDATTNKVEVTMYNAAGTICQATTDTATGTAAWTETALTNDETALAGCTAIAANDIVIFRIKLTASAGEFARAGAIRFDYYSKW